MHTTHPALVCLLASLALAGCTQRLNPAAAPRAAGPDTAPPLSYYEVGGEIPEPTSIEVEVDNKYFQVRRIHLPARVPAGLEDHPHADDDIEIVHFRPRPLGGTPRPLILMSPILGNDMTLMPEFARGFVRHGWHAAVVVRKEFSFEAETALQDAEKEFRSIVMRSKQALDWLCTLEEVDEDRIGTFGVSAGAIIGACIAGADTRAKAHVLVFAGGPLADVLLDTTEGRFERYGKGVEEETGMGKEEIRLRLREALRTDPTRLAPRIRTDQVLLFVAKNDTSVPTRHGMTLWNALGRPELRVLPWGHYASFLLFPWMQHEANVFLRARLGSP